MDDQEIAALLREAKTVAVVGLSPREARPSNRVAKYLMDVGYTVIPVNPGQTELLGQPCYASLSATNQALDIIDIFRKSEDVLPIVEEALTLPFRPKAIWMQLGIANAAAAKLAEEAGIMVIMDKCTKIEHERLL